VGDSLTIAPRIEELQELLPPQPRIELNFTLDTYNTVELHEREIWVLRTPYFGPYYYNILNLGPGVIYYRDQVDPQPPDDPHSVTLPPFCADNLVLIPVGPEGLRVIAWDMFPTKITLRLVRG
jgi:hypothetical protein